MTFGNIIHIIRITIFGKHERISFHRKIFILLNFLTIALLLLAIFSNFLLELNIWANIVLIIGLGFLIFFYLNGRNSKNYEKTVVPLFLFSIIFFSTSWCFNGGYDSNISLLMLSFFLSIYMLVKVNLRHIVFYSYLFMYIILVGIQFYYPDMIVGYLDKDQRALDILITGIFSILFLYLIIDTIVKNFSMENKKIAEMNSELKNKNDEIARINEELKEYSERLSMALSVSKQAWFDLDIPTGISKVSKYFPEMLGYTYQEYKPSFQNWVDSIYPDDREKTVNSFYNLLEKSTTFTLKYRFLSKDGNWIWLQSTGKVIEFSEDGNPKRMIGTHLDISELMTAEIALRESEEKYRALVDNAWEGIAIFNMNGAILFANRSLAHTVGIKDIDDLVGRKVFDFIATEYIPLVIKDFSNVMQGQDSYISVYKCFSIDRTELWLESKGKVIHFEGEPAVLVSLRDITERRHVEHELRENEEKYRNLFNTMPNGFYRSTPEGYFIEANPAMVKILGYENLDELRKVHIPSQLYVSEEERYDLDVYNDDFISENEIYRLKRKDGEIVWFEDNARYIKDEYGNIIYHEGICRDITNRLRKDADLKDSESRLKELNATKDKFFSIIAHDLKNPLGNFQSISKLLYEQYDYFSEEDKKEYIKAIKDASEQVYELLENLLDWSRSQRGKIVFNPDKIDLYYVSISCIGALNLSATNKGIKILNNIRVGSICYVDANLVTTIIRNLISNAIKFTSENDTIEIGILNNNFNDNSMICVFVKDTGVGMTQEIKDKIFRIDQNVSTLGTSQEKGTGLGLILCKEFVEMHNGKIWVDSEPGKGSTFCFTLPKEDTNNSRK